MHFFCTFKLFIMRLNRDVTHCYTEVCKTHKRNFSSKTLKKSADDECKSFPGQLFTCENAKVPTGKNKDVKWLFLVFGELVQLL